MSKTKCGFQRPCLDALNSLSPRQREVLARRFGLLSGSPETLQKIGSDFKITRERVRQLERDGLNNLRKNNPNCLKPPFNSLKQHLQRQGGVSREKALLEQFGQDEQSQFAYFLLVLGDLFYRFAETARTFAFWSLQKNAQSALEKKLGALASRIKKSQRPLNQEELLGVSISALDLSALEIAKEIAKSPLGEFGLSSWPEVRPRGVKDAAYLALKQKGKPLHFRNITQRANNIKGLFDNREILPQTVHNELIRDPRFVLVGRGIYGLSEWGYQNGAVKDIIVNVLKQAPAPLPKQEILEKVMAQRLVKANTILLNLNNQALFAKNADGTYHLAR